MSRLKSMSVAGWAGVSAGEWSWVRRAPSAAIRAAARSERLRQNGVQGIAGPRAGGRKRVAAAGSLYLRDRPPGQEAGNAGFSAADSFRSPWGWASANESNTGERIGRGVGDRLFVAAAIAAIAAFMAILDISDIPDILAIDSHMGVFSPPRLTPSPRLVPSTHRPSHPPGRSQTHHPAARPPLLGARHASAPPFGSPRRRSPRTPARPGRVQHSRRRHRRARRRDQHGHVNNEADTIELAANSTYTFSAVADPADGGTPCRPSSATPPPTPTP